jgi:antitoxin VapB
MSLNIENLKTCTLIEELAKVTGETMTAAVTTAVRERLDRLRPESDDAWVEKILAIARDCAKHLGPDFNGHDEIAALYDENGLPK